MTNKNNHTVEELNKEDKPFELVSKFQLTQDQKKAVNITWLNFILFEAKELPISLFFFLV